MALDPHTVSMHSILPIAFIESVAATQRGLIGARRDDPRRLPERKRSGADHPPERTALGSADAGA